jgi:hypothetical protein
MSRPNTVMRTISRIVWFVVLTLGAGGRHNMWERRVLHDKDSAHHKYTQVWKEVPAHVTRPGTTPVRDGPVRSVSAVTWTMPPHTTDPNKEDRFTPPLDPVHRDADLIEAAPSTTDVDAAVDGQKELPSVIFPESPPSEPGITTHESQASDDQSITRPSENKAPMDKSSGMKDEEDPTITSHSIVDLICSANTPQPSNSPYEAPPVATRPGSRLAISHAGQQVIVFWTGPGVLESATHCSGPWVRIPGAKSPFREPILERKFFRLVDAP